MKMDINSFKGLAYQTRLLESLSWDEQQLKALFEYLHVAFNADIVVHPDKILSTVKEYFGEDTYTCFKSILSEVMVENNLHISGEQYEH